MLIGLLGLNLLWAAGSLFFGYLWRESSFPVVGSAPASRGDFVASLAGPDVPP
jgi:hypothetical protein